MVRTKLRTNATLFGVMRGLSGALSIGGMALIQCVGTANHARRYSA